MRLFTPPFYLYGFVLAIIAISAVAFAETIAIDKVLVIVNNEPITLSEYRARHQRELLEKSSDIQPFSNKIKQEILEQMINERIQAQVALRRGIQINPKEVDQAISAIAQQNDTTTEQLLEYLNQNGIAADQFRGSIREERMFSRLVEIAVHSRIVVNQTEVDNYLKRHEKFEPLEQKEEYEVSHMLISLEGKSKQNIQSEYENLEHIRQSLLEGRSFKKSVIEFSDSPEKEKGGHLGWRSELPDIFMHELRQLEAGEISSILRSENALHLLKLHNKRSGNIVQQQLIKHILVRASGERSQEEARELADKLYQDILNGEDFDLLAKKYSPGDGELGWVNPAQLPHAFFQAMKTLETGDISKPFVVQTGYHIVKVLDQREHDISSELIANRARQIIFGRKSAELYENWSSSIRDAAYVEYVSATSDP